MDKTLLIKELLDKKGKVTLFTRPRRFGKTLNLSMLKYYFEDTGDEERNRQNAKLFSELAISSAGEFYCSEMVKYPVITFHVKSAKQKGLNLFPLYEAIEEGNMEVMEEEISSLLEQTISYFDYGESYYHGFLVGLLERNGKYRVLSNRETGLGRADIILKTPRIRKGRAVILEIKAVKNFHDMKKGCEEALRQIEEKKYAKELRQEGYEDIRAYGICFYRKECIIEKMLEG